MAVLFSIVHFDFSWAINRVIKRIRPESLDPKRIGALAQLDSNLSPPFHWNCGD